MIRCKDCGGRIDRPGLFECRIRHPHPTLAQKIAARIERDICDRRGLRQAFESIEDDTQDMIRDEWARLIELDLP